MTVIGASPVTTTRMADVVRHVRNANKTAETPERTAAERSMHRGKSMHSPSSSAMAAMTVFGVIPATNTEREDAGRHGPQGRKRSQEGNQRVDSVVLSE